MRSPPHPSTLMPNPPNDPPKSPEKSPAGELVPQPHGGALRNGSTPGTNAGGTGRPPSAIREKLRGSFSNRIATLERIADDDGQTTADRIRALDLLAKYGLGTTRELTVETVRGRLEETIRAIEETLAPEEAEKLLDRLETIWR